MAPQIHHDSPDHEICDFPASRGWLSCSTALALESYTQSWCFIPCRPWCQSAQWKKNLFVPVEFLALDLLRSLPLPFRWLNSFQWKCALQGWVSATTCLKRVFETCIFLNDVFPPREWLTIDYSVNMRNRWLQSWFLLMAADPISTQDTSNFHQLLDCWIPIFLLSPTVWWFNPNQVDGWNPSSCQTFPHI